MPGTIHTPHAPLRTYGQQDFKFPTMHTAFGAELANTFQSVYEDLTTIGATGSAQRLVALDLYAERSKKSFDPAAVALRANLDEMQTELEDTLGASARKWSSLRNVLALTPLLLTWMTLGVATAYYYIYYLAHNHAGKNDVVVQPFIVAWESGFDHRLFFTFAEVAWADFCLLFIVLACTVVMQWMEGQALVAVNNMFERVSAAISAYVDALYAQKIQSDLRASPEQWAQRAEEVITRAMTNVETTIRTAQQVIRDAAKVMGGFEKRTDDLFTRIDARITSVVKSTGDTLTSTVQDLRRELGDYTDQTTKLLASVDKVNQAATTLQQNVGEYTRLARSIDGHVASLEVAQKDIAGKMTTASDSIGMVANTFKTETLGILAKEVQDAATALQAAVINQAVIPSEFLEAAKALHQAADDLADKVVRQSAPYPGGSGGGYGAPVPVPGGGHASSTPGSAYGTGASAPGRTTGGGGLFGWLQTLFRGGL